MAAPATAILSSVPREQETTPKHVTALDGVRGIAILLVIIHHLAMGFLTGSGPVSNAIVETMRYGWIGVDLFFALSGFLITGILLDTKNAAHRIRSFYGRRVLRIFPLYYLALLLAFTVSQIVLLHHPWRQPMYPSTTGWLSYVFYFQNWWMPIHEPHAFLVAHFWSLGVEEQFYLLWPVCVWFLPKSRLWMACLTGILLAFLLRFALLRSGGAYADPQFIYTNVLTRMDALLAGGLGAVLVRTPQMAGHVRRWAWVFFAAVSVGFGFLAYCAIWTFGAYDVQLLGYSFSALGCGALVVLAYYSSHILNQAFSYPALRFFGRYSYGIYVYHVFVNQAVSAPFGKYAWFQQRWMLHSIGLSLLVTGVSVAIAFCSFHLFEKRFLRLKRYFPAEAN